MVIVGLVMFGGCQRATAPRLGNVQRQGAHLVVIPRLYYCSGNLSFTVTGIVVLVQR